MMTRSPRWAWVTEQLAPIAQSLPIADTGADHGVGADQPAGSDVGGRTDHRERIDRDALAKLRRRMHHRARRDANGAEHRRRAQRAAVNPARDRDKGVIRFAHAQHRDAFGRMARETLGGQHGPGLRRLQRRDELGFGDEGEVGRASLIGRRNTGQAAGEIGSLARLGSGQCGNLSDAEIRIARKKTELGHNPRPLRQDLHNPAGRYSQAEFGRGRVPLTVVPACRGAVTSAHAIG